MCGEARDATYKEWIDVLAWRAGAYRNRRPCIRVAVAAAAARPTQDMSITAFTDTSTTDLWAKCATGKHYPEAKLICRKRAIPCRVHQDHHERRDHQQHLDGGKAAVKTVPRKTSP
ncbi:MAG: type VI secretion system tube protein Hcp [Gammaproteobacteria bacterium]